jgi:hypothetical protein
MPVMGFGADAPLSRARSLYHKRQRDEGGL